MATLTQMRNGASVWHDADTDRETLHARFLAYQESEDWKAISHRAVNTDSFSFEQADGSWIHTIVVTFTVETALQLSERYQKEEAQAEVKRLRKVIQRAREVLG